MSRVGLTTLLGLRRQAAGVVTAIADVFGTAVAIEDLDGQLLHGASPRSGGQRYPVSVEGERVGWVSGAEPARALAALLDHLLTRESERKALGTEVLHLYREVNLIYAFSEKLAALLDLDRVARLTITEARHLITASDGAILLLDDESGRLSTLAGFGEMLPHAGGMKRGEGIVGGVVATGTAEIVNDVAADPRRASAESGVRAILCAPLKVGERVIGAIALGNTGDAVYTAAELKLLNTLALQTATAIENARLFERTVQSAREREALLAANQEIEVARAKLEREFELAARIQADLFPALPVVSGYDLAARNRPARQCGGDYYDALPLAAGSESRLLLCVADVSGKGMPAALLMSHMQATLRALVGRAASLPALATQASDLLFASTAGNKYVTAALLDIEPSEGQARYVSAGHVDGLLVRASGDSERLESTGTPLGLLPPGIPYEERIVSVEPGDCLVLYSDGVVDAQNDRGEEFGEQRLFDIVARSRIEPAALVVDRVFQAIDAFVAGAPQFDDITIMVMQRQRHAGT